MVKKEDFGLRKGGKMEHSRSYVTLFATNSKFKRAFFNSMDIFEMASR
jgi:hypothetical protein